MARPALNESDACESWRKGYTGVLAQAGVVPAWRTFKTKPSGMFSNSSIHRMQVDIHYNQRYDPTVYYAIRFVTRARCALSNLDLKIAPPD